MPSVNPPADAGQAQASPDIEMTDGAAAVRAGPRLQCDTLPQPCAFRYVILSDADGRTFAGYLWEQ